MNRNKVIMVVVDGLRFDTARTHMGFLNHLAEKGEAGLYKVQSELPSLSRPLYEVLLTGTPSSRNGITSNAVVRLSNQESIFHLAAAHGLTTAAAAFCWVSELYNEAPFDPFRHREQDDPSKPIQHGRFYYHDAYPDSHLFADAEGLRRRVDPDFLYIHSMGVDDGGHLAGADSKLYRQRVMIVDDLLAVLVPAWREHGYQVIVTSDHGMDNEGMHGGTRSEERDVPLFTIGDRFEPGIFPDTVPQLALAPAVCSLLGLKPSSAMIGESIPGWPFSE